MTKKLTTNQQNEIIEKYTTTNVNCYELGRQYNVYGESISSFLKRRGIKIRQVQGRCNRKDFVNENYFEKIDSEEKAYFLGFLYADGYNDTERGCVELGLQETDKYILDKFRKIINSNQKLGFKNRSKQNLNWQNQFRLHIYSKKFSSDLEKLGCVKCKSMILQFPNQQQVPKRLVRHFIRGVLDGDGNIDIRKADRYNGLCFRARITSTIMFCESLKLLVKDILDINSYIESHSNRKNKITKSINIGGNLQTVKFLDWIYKDAIIYLDRKYDKYKKMKEYNVSKGR